MDLAFPFCLRLAPFPFNSVANMVEWILHHIHNVSHLMHYLEDFITADNLARSLAVCRVFAIFLRPLHFFFFSSLYVPGIQNSVADALSRFYWQDWAQVVVARGSVASIPPQLLGELIS